MKFVKQAEKKVGGQNPSEKICYGKNNCVVPIWL